MNKRQQILRDLDEDLVNSDVEDVLAQLDKYQIEPPSIEATNQLIQSLKPIFSQEFSEVKKAQRFRDIVVATRKEKTFPVIFSLILSQTALISKEFVVLTIVVFMAGVLVGNVFNSGSSKFLVAASPFLGILTLFYEYRARLYKVEEIEATCYFLPSQVAAGRILVVLGYNVILGIGATLIIETYTFAIWNLIMNWLAPLLLIVGIALFSSLKFGIVGGCTVAGTVWSAQLLVMEKGTFIQLFLPNLTDVIANIVSMFLGIGLLYISLNLWQKEGRLVQVR